MEPVIHIGYPKAGSTWLQKVVFGNDKIPLSLRLHRRHEVNDKIVKPHPLNFSPKKAKLFFRKKITKDTKEKAVISSERLVGNPHSGGYDSSIIAERLNNVFPSSKIIIIIRNQIDIIASSYKQYVGVGGTEPIDRYLHPPYRRQKRVPLFTFDFFHYDRIAEKYVDLFGKDNVLLLPFEMIPDEDVRFVRDMLKFSGVYDKTYLEYLDDSGIFRDKRNASLSNISLKIKRIANYIFGKTDVNRGAPVVNSSVFSRYISKMLKRSELILGTERDFSNLREQVKRRVSGRYIKSNNRVNKLCKYDISQYGYET